MEGSFLSKTFSFLRSNDLVYGPAIKSYLMEKNHHLLIFYTGTATQQTFQEEWP